MFTKERVNISRNFSTTPLGRVIYKAIISNGRHGTSVCCPAWLQHGALHLVSTLAHRRIAVIEPPPHWAVVLRRNFFTSRCSASAWAVKRWKNSDDIFGSFDTVWWTDGRTDDELLQQYRALRVFACGRAIKSQHRWCCVAQINKNENCTWKCLPTLLIWVLTLRCPLMPYGYSYKASCARPG